jgi:multicomponent Na+:H+ antiporter subunit D
VTTVLAPLLLAVPLLAAVVLRVGRPPRAFGDATAVLAAATTAGLGGVLLTQARTGTVVHWVAGWEPIDGSAVGIALVADPVAAGTCVLAGVLTTAALASTWGHADTVDLRSHALGLVFLAALCGFVLAGDVLTLFVFLELVSITAYVLTGYRPEERGALQGAIVFAVTNTVGATLFLAGATVLYAHAGTPNLAEIGVVVAETGASGPVVVALTLLTAGLFAKAAIVPFHFWHADSHTVAPGWAATLFSGVLIQVAVYGIARLYATAFAGTVADHPEQLRGLLVAAAVVTAVVAGVFCLLQDDLKRLLAFSTVAHVGIALGGVGLLEGDGVAGAAVYVVGHGLVKGGLFLVAAWLVHRFGTASISQLHGRLAGRRTVGALLAVGALALAGTPPFGLYSGKVLLSAAAETVGYDWLEYVVYAVAILTGAAVLRAAAALALGVGSAHPLVPGGTVPEAQPEDAGTRSPHSGTEHLLPATLLVLLAAVIGPLGAVTHAAQEAGERFLDHDRYVAAVLEGDRARAPRPEPEELFTASSLVPAGVAALVTVGLAVAVVRTVPGAPDGRASGRAGRAVARLRALHSGHVSDYLVWQLVGTTGLAVAFTSLLRT